MTRNWRKVWKSSIWVVASIVVLLAWQLVVGGMTVYGPDGGNWIKCARSCGNAYNNCHRGCNPMDDWCWDQCLNIYVGCLSGCEGAPYMDDVY